jgi:two-component system cell cycle sensor histidine kinase/response regulator CckA
MRNRFNQIDDSERASATRVVSKQRDIEPHRLNLNQLLVQLSGGIEHILGPGIAFRISSDQDLPPVLGVGNMLKLAVMDLCAAARADIGGRGRVTIVATVKVVEEQHAGRFLDGDAGAFVCLSIRQMRSATQANAEWNHDLANVYAIAQQHCGWLEVVRDGEGSVSYDLYFPVGDLGEGTTQFGEEAIEIPGGCETILLVEDELNLLSLTRDILERYGYRIITAPGGGAALRIWRERHHEIDLLLTDVRMPEGISGHELAERLLADKPELKVIYVTGYTVESNSVLAFQNRPNFITKPFTPPGLAQTVRRALDWQTTAQAA